MANYPDINSTQATNLLLDALAQHLTRAIAGASKQIGIRIGFLAAAAIQVCPEYESLISGELRGELGVVSAEPVLKRVIENISSGVQVTSRSIVRTGQNITGSMLVELVKGDYSDVLGVDGAEFVSEGRYDIPWLRWLTLEGDRILISDYRFDIAQGTPKGRTGQGLMLKNGSWRVPPEFAGTEEDNWILRSLARVVEDFPAIMVAAISEGT